MRVTVLSDLHGHIPEDLEPGDLLIVAGDLTGSDQYIQYFNFFDWLERQKFRKKILVSGNHDMMMELENYEGPPDKEFEYLNESMTEFEGLKIWGSPLSLWFSGINPRASAFTRSEEELEVFYEKIPDDIDILISHGPALGILDLTKRKRFVGSRALLNAVDRIKPKLLVTAHIHETYGHLLYKHQGPNTLCVNASLMNEEYEIVNEPYTLLITPNYIEVLKPTKEILCKS